MAACIECTPSTPLSRLTRNTRTRADWPLVENIGRRSLGSSGGVERDMDTGTIAEAITKAVARDGPDPNENMRLAFEL